MKKVLAILSALSLLVGASLTHAHADTGIHLTGTPQPYKAGHSGNTSQVPTLVQLPATGGATQ